MRVLALDTSSSACNVALLDEDRFFVDEAELGTGHAEYLIPQLSAFISRVGIAFWDIDKLAVTVGPGSFLGIKIGLATVRALSLVLSVPAVGIGTLEALAAKTMKFGDGAVLAILDAGRFGFYAQAFDVLDEQCVSLSLPNLCSVDKVIELAKKLRITRIIGTGASQISGLLPASTIIYTGATPSIKYVATRGRDLEFAPVSPLYLRSAVC